MIFTDRLDKPNIVTNFAPSRFGASTEMPTDDGIREGYVFTRYRMMQEAIGSRQSLETPDLFGIADIVSFDALAGLEGGDPLRPFRTLWTGIYDLDERSLQLSLYEGEGEGETRRSSPVRLALLP